MLTLNQMNEERGRLAKRIREMADVVGRENREFTSLEREEWNRVNQRHDELTVKVQDHQRQAVSGILPGRADRVGGTRIDGGDEERRCVALQAWTRRQFGLPLSGDQVDAAAEVGLDLHSTMIDFGLSRTRDARALQREFRRHPDIEHRALSVVTGSAGAYMVPTSFMTSLETAMLAYSGVRQAAQVIRTDSGNAMPWPTVNDTSNEGELIGENTEVAEQDITVASQTLSAYKYSSKLIRVPVELLEDSAFDLAAELGRLLGERIGRICNRHYTTGTDSGQPQGIVTGSTLGVTTASATAIAADDIIKLAHSVDPAYRTGPGVGYMMNDAVLQTVRLLKDGNGNYLWQSGVASGQPDRLNGYPYFLNQHMASTVEASAKTMLFGDLSAYKIRDVRGIRLRRLVERYAEYDQEGFIAFFRSDGMLLDAGTHPVKHLIQHT